MYRIFNLLVRKRKLLIPFLIAAPYPYLNALEYDGYFRSGIGISKDDTDQVCFKGVGTEGGIGTKHRLGNECDTYLELGLSEEYRMGRSLTDPLFKTYVRLAFRSAGHRDWESSELEFNAELQRDGGNDEITGITYEKNQEAVFAIREVYAEATNLVGPSSAKFWIGKRFYRRRDLYMLDFYIFENVGPGFGIEDLDINFAKAHIAFLRNLPYDTENFTEKDGPIQTNLDFRISDIPIGDSGKLETILIYGKTSKSGNQTGDERWEPLTGWQLGIVHEQEEIFGTGKNMFAFQYGKGLFGAIHRQRLGGYWTASLLSQYGGYASQNIAKDDKDELDAVKKSSTLRLSDEMIINPSPDYSLGALLFYQDIDFGGKKHTSPIGDTEDRPNKKEFTFGIRPIWHISDTFDLAVEYGYSEVKKSHEDQTDTGEYKFFDTRFQKLTIAPQISAGREYWAYSKPQLRLFYTKAFWDDASKGRIGGDVYSDVNSGWSAGAQVEVWW